MTARSNPPAEKPDLPSALTDPIRERLFNSRSLIISGEINQQQASNVISQLIALQLLPGLDAFVLSSLHEGLSIALVEALAAGVPIVATRVGGIPELVIHGQYGLLVPPSEPGALASAMAWLARDPEVRTRLAAAGPVRAADFGIQPAADRLVSHYLVLGPRQPVGVDE